MLPFLLIFFPRWVLFLGIPLDWGHSSVHAEADVQFMLKVQQRKKVSVKKVQQRKRVNVKASEVCDKA